MCSRGKKDTLFNAMVPKSSFAFNTDVAEVFDDMASRSIPGYRAQQRYIAHYIALLIKERHTVSIVDMGCSTGETLAYLARFAKKEKVHTKRCSMIATDYSNAMLAQCEDTLKQYRDDWKSIELMELDLMQSECFFDDMHKKDMSQTVVLLLHFVLQFLPLEYRERVLKNCWSIVRVGGSMFISEKLKSADVLMQQSWEYMQYSFKKSMGYSDMQIASKKSALEGVLIPQDKQDFETMLDSLPNSTIQTYYSHGEFHCYHIQKSI